MPKALQTEALLLLPLLLLPADRQQQAASLIVRSIVHPEGIPAALRLPALHALNLLDISGASCADAAAMLEEVRCPCCAPSAACCVAVAKRAPQWSAIQLKLGCVKLRSVA